MAASLPSTEAIPDQSEALGRLLDQAIAELEHAGCEDGRNVVFELYNCVEVALDVPIADTGVEVESLKGCADFFGRCVSAVGRLTAVTASYTQPSTAFKALALLFMERRIAIEVRWRQYRGSLPDRYTSIQPRLVDWCDHIVL